MTKQQFQQILERLDALEKAVRVAPTVLIGTPLLPPRLPVHVPIRPSSPHEHPATVPYFPNATAWKA